MKLSTKAVAALRLPPGKSESIVFDDALPGFGVRLRASGAARWIYQFKVGAKQRRLTLGVYPALSVDQARGIASELSARVRLGGDPAAEKAESRAQLAKTFKAVVQKYLDYQKGEMRPRSYREIVRHLNVNAKPLHGETLAKINRTHIANLIAGLPANKFHVHATLSAFFTWAMREGLIDVNPVAQTHRPPKPESRERVLAQDEIRDVWRALEDDDFGDIVRLLVLSGTRRDEIGALQWQEVDLDAALISLPGDRTKNKKPFDLPLSSAALSVLRGRERDDDRDFVFGRGRGGFSGWSACKARLDVRIAELREAEGRPPMAAWTLHDLRRTFSTMAHDKLKIQPHVVEACLNHFSGHRASVAGVYNRAQYREEKRQALAKWGDFIAGVVEGRDNVI
ncbi:MAG TPA: integrase arm-type DNA-binding domain-containing protein, partial [Methylocystis sp.]